MKAFQKLSTSTLRALQSAEVIQREDILVFRLKGGIPHAQVLSFLNELKHTILQNHPELDGKTRVLDMWKETIRPKFPEGKTFNDLTDQEKQDFRNGCEYRVHSRILKPKIVTNVDRERLVPRTGAFKTEYSRIPPMNKANTFGADFENSIRPISSFDHNNDNEGKGKYLERLKIRREEARLLATRSQVQQEFKKAA